MQSKLGNLSDNAVIVLIVFLSGRSIRQLFLPAGLTFKPEPSALVTPDPGVCLRLPQWELMSSLSQDNKSFRELSSSL